MQYITIGISSSDGTASILKQPSVPYRDQIDYIEGLGEFSSTYKSVHVVALDYNKASELELSVAVTVTAANQSITYGDAVPTYTATASSGTLSEIVPTVSYACSYAVGSDVGTYPITPGGTAESGYNVTFVNGTLTVIKKDAMVTVADVSMTAGGSQPTFSVTASGLIEGDTLSDLGTPTYKITVNSVDTPIADVDFSTLTAGSYAIKASGLAGTKAGNYNIGYQPGILTVGSSE